MLTLPFLFAQVLDSSGIATDSAGNVFVTGIAETPTGTSSVIEEFSPSGIRLRSATVSSGVVAFPGSLVALGPSASTLSPNLQAGDILVLMPGGQILDYRPTAGTVTPFFNLTSIKSPDASGVFDVATGQTGDFSSQITPQLADYGDIAVLGQEILVTGTSAGRLFVMRVQFLDGLLDSAKVLLTSTASESGSVRARGVAVNSAGLALTTLPVPQNGILANGQDEPIGFGINFDQRQGAAPYVALAKHVDSRGIKTDSLGNFLIATGPAGSALCQSSQCIVTADPSLTQFHSLPMPVSTSTQNPDGHAVVASPDGRWCYMAFTDLGQVWRMPMAQVRSAPVDFNGDGKTDVGVFRPPTAQWFIFGGSMMQFGAEGDWPVPADYNGDGRSEYAVYRPSTAQWFIAGSGMTQFGAPGDVSVPGDYNGDGKTDLAVFRPSTAQWFIMGSAGGGRAVQFGALGDIPVPGDYDGDGKTDLAVYRPSTSQWFIMGSTSGGRVVPFGGPGLDVPVPADYDGDGKTDLAVYRPTTAVWYVLGQGSWQFGEAGVDLPVPADYTGAGKANLAVYRPPTGQWFFAHVGVIQFGMPLVDVPLTLPLAYRAWSSNRAPGFRTASLSTGGGNGGLRTASFESTIGSDIAYVPLVASLPSSSDLPPAPLQPTSLLRRVSRVLVS